MLMGFAPGSKMKGKRWFPIGAILGSASIGDMLGRRAVLSNTHLQLEKIGGQTTLVANGFAAAALQGVSPKGVASRLKRGASDPSPEIASDVIEPEELTLSRVPIGDPGSLDPAEEEALLLAEQLAGQVRNPAFLQPTPEVPAPEETEEED
jgi:hypothetical protein